MHTGSSRMYTGSNNMHTGTISTNMHTGTTSTSTGTYAYWYDFYFGTNIYMAHFSKSYGVKFLSI